MEKYGVDVELAFYDTVFVEANSREEAQKIVMETYPFEENYKVLAYGIEYDFGNVEFMGVGEVVSE